MPMNLLNIFTDTIAIATFQPPAHHPDERHRSGDDDAGETAGRTVNTVTDQRSAPLATGGRDSSAAARQIPAQQVLAR